MFKKNYITPKARLHTELYGNFFDVIFIPTLYFMLCANEHAVGWDMWVDSIYNLLLLSIQISHDIILRHLHM